MPVPALITDMSSTISLNSPQGSESAKGTIDDYLRSHAGFIKQLYDALLGPSVTLASAATVAIGFASSANITITGTTNISAFDTAPEGTLRYITFTGALTIIHNASSMALPGAQNLGTSSADAAIFKSLGGGNWKCMFYQRSNGAGPVFATASRDGSLSASDWTAFNAKQAAGVCLPKAGGRMTGNLEMSNNTGLFFVDSSGNLQQILVFAGDNNIYLNMGPGGLFRVQNAQASATIFQMNNQGNIVPSGGVTLKNNTPLYLTDAGGNVRATIYIDPSNWLNHFGGPAGTRWWNGASNAVIASLSDAGVFSANVLTETSDERKKTNWRPLTDEQLDALAAIENVGVFDWIDGIGSGVGGPAQKIQAIVPEAVHEGEDGTLKVAYSGLAFAMAHAALRRSKGMQP